MFAYVIDTNYVRSIYFLMSTGFFLKFLQMAIIFNCEIKFPSETNTSRVFYCKNKY